MKDVDKMSECELRSEVRDLRKALAAMVIRCAENGIWIKDIFEEHGLELGS